MGIVFGVINIIVAVWFFASAASVKKQAVMWAVIGGLSFITFKLLGYSMIGLLQGSLDQSIISDLVDKGYTQTERSTFELSKETFDDQSVFMGVIFEFFPLILALLGVSFIRAKYILGMDFIASLKHKTSIVLTTTKGSSKPSDSSSFTGTISGWWKKIRKS